MDKIKTQDELSSAAGRIKYIDGIKGIACLSVVIAHFSQVFFPNMLAITEPITIIEKILILSPLNIFINGNFGVHCFFVLTGFLICNKVSNGKPATSPAKLYIHLLKLVIPSVLLAAILMRLDLMFHLKSEAFVSVQNYNNFTPRFFDCIYDMFIRTFFRTSEYVGPLWTISYSYFGSLLAYAVIYYAKQMSSSQRITVYIIFALVTYHLNQQMISFILGGIAYECSRLYKSRKTFWLQLLLLILGIYLAFINRECVGIYLPFKPLLAIYARFDSIIRAIGISVCIVFIDNSPVMITLFSKRGISKVGRVSMYCYSFHWPIILSMGCGVYTFLVGKINTTLLKGFILIIVIISVLILSTIALKTEERCFGKKQTSKCEI